MDYLKQGILVLATMEMAKRKRGSSFCPSDVVRWLYPNDWRYFMEEEMKAAMWLFDQDLIEIRQGGNLIDQNYLPEAPVRLIIK